MSVKNLVMGSEIQLERQNAEGILRFAKKAISERWKVRLALLPPHNQEVFPLCASGFNEDFRCNFCIVSYVRRLWLMITDVNAHDLLSTPRKKDKSTVPHKLPKRFKKWYRALTYFGLPQWGNSDQWYVWTRKLQKQLYS